MRVGGAHHKVRANLAFTKKRIAANLASFMMLFGITKQFGHFAFGDPAADLLGQQRRTALKRACQCVKHTSRYMRNTGHDKDIAVPDSRLALHFVGNKFSAVWHTCHAQTAGIDAATRFIICM